MPPVVRPWSENTNATGIVHRGIQSLSVNKTLVLASGFWPPLTVPQSQNPRRSAATPVVLFNRRNQIRLKIRRDPLKA
jgi:hypothetical protein